MTDTVIYICYNPLEYKQMFVFRGKKMSQGLSDELIALSAMMLTAQTRGEFVALSSKMIDLVEQVMQLERHEPQRKEKTLSATIKFSKEEGAKMSKTFKKEFIAAGLVAHIIKRPSGKNGFYYEIRYRRNGFNISVSNKDLATAKKLFIERTHNLEKKANDLRGSHLPPLSWRTFPEVLLFVIAFL